MNFFNITNVKKCKESETFFERSEILPYLQANELVCHHCMDASTRFDITESDIEGLDYSGYSQQHEYPVCLRSPGVPRPRGLAQCCSFGGFQHSRGTLSLGNPSLLLESAWLSLVLQGDLIFIILHSQQTWSLPWRQTLFLFSNAVCYTNLLEKTTSNANSDFAPKMGPNARDPWRNVFVKPKDRVPLQLIEITNVLKWCLVINSS